jgi:leukotriene-A4 hydrolase
MWLTKEQTSMKKQPYVFSQCQSIFARSLLPCQDTPSTRMSYSAQVTAIKEVEVLMSAVKGESTAVSDTHRVHKFEQKIAIPSYLIAIVAGAIENKRIGPRSVVWAEKDLLETAAFDFADTEKMLQVGENLFGEYVWGVYDILVLPPSFPFGGMENPCLTFVTPTLLTGDKSMANVIAHEICHSWFGNLVCTRTFEYFWLNEGFTVFAERKILGALHGEKFRQFCHIGGITSLTEDVKSYGMDHPLTKLVPNLDLCSPEDSFSRVPYDKGSTFLYYLEEKVGGASKSLRSVGFDMESGVNI